MTLRAPQTTAILIAAGESTRMAARVTASIPRKPFLELAGITLLEHAAVAFDQLIEVVELVLVVHPDDIVRAEALRRASRAFAKVRSIVPGGAERTDSVRLGVSAAASDAGLVAIHDAARPLVSSAAIRRALEAAQRHGAASLALPVGDTLKRSSDGSRAEETEDRSQLWLAQTPQVFDAPRFRECLSRAERDLFRPTDDAALWERYIGPVALVRGEVANLKITAPEDLELARAVLAARRALPSAGGAQR